MYPAQVLRGAGAERTGTKERAPGARRRRRARAPTAVGAVRIVTIRTSVGFAPLPGAASPVSSRESLAPRLRSGSGVPVGSRLAHGLARILGNLCSSGYYNV